MYMDAFGNPVDAYGNLVLDDGGYINEHGEYVPYDLDAVNQADSVPYNNAMSAYGDAADNAGNTFTEASGQYLLLTMPKIYLCSLLCALHLANRLLTKLGAVF